MGATESKKTTTETVPEEKPKKRQLTPYMKFCKKMRPKVVSENPDLSFGGIGRKLGEMWRELDEEGKKKYVK